MATKLKGLKITSTDLVEQGANQDAHIRLFKRRDDDGDGTPIKKIASAFVKAFSMLAGDKENIAKEAETFDENVERERLWELAREMSGFCNALRESFYSIILDTEIGNEEKQTLMLTSLTEFTAAMDTAIPKWAESGSAATKAQTAANTTNQEKEEIDTMKIDKSKMTEEEKSVLEGFEKKYGAGEESAEPPVQDGVTKGQATAPAEGAGGLHPEVKKVLSELEEVRKTQTAEIEGLKKSLEMEQLATVAKKYETIGKKADELAAKLYELKKAGGTVYDDFVALLDEQAAIVEKSGLFSELGSNREGSAGDSFAKLNAAAIEVMKRDASLSQAAAFVKACEENPALHAEYESEFLGRRI
jgi:hypothetical protein